MISNADNLPYLPRTPGRGIFQAATGSSHHNSADTVSFARGRAYRRVPPQVRGRPCGSIIDSRVCHRARLAKFGSESTLIAHACAVVAPSFFRLPLSQPREICT